MVNVFHLPARPEQNASDHDEIYLTQLIHESLLLARNLVD
jgi:hypothetical protein